MAWWASWWWGAHRHTSLAFGTLDGAPLVRVHCKSPDELDAMARALGRGDGDELAAATVVHEQPAPHPTAVLFFSDTLGFTPRQLETIGHEVSHVVARLLKLERDPTHDDNGGVISS